MCPRSLLQISPLSGINRGEVTRSRADARIYTVCPTHKTSEAYTLDIALQELMNAAQTMGAESETLREGLHGYWSQAWVITLIGKSGIGKSNLVDTLANRQIGSLTKGKISETIAQFKQGTDFLIDTPGLDTPHATIANLEPVAKNTDMLIWVIDGTKKISANERLVLASIRSNGQPVHVALTQLDRASTQQRRAAVDKARSALSHIYPLSVRIVDGHSEARALSYLVRQVPWGSPRRLEWIQKGLDSVHSWLAKNQPKAPPIVHRQYLFQRWKSLVQATHNSVCDKLDLGQTRGQTNALNLFSKRSKRATVAYNNWLRSESPFREWLPLTGYPVLPSTEAKESTPLADLLGGKRLAQRTLEATANQWQLNGESAIEAWIQRAEDHDDVTRRDQYERLENVLRVTETTLEKAQQLLRQCQV